MPNIKKETEDAVESVVTQSVQTMLTKEQILASARYANRRDLVDALLDEYTSYTTETVDELVDSFLKGKVN